MIQEIAKEHSDFIFKKNDFANNGSYTVEALAYDGQRFVFNLFFFERDFGVSVRVQKNDWNALGCCYTLDTAIEMMRRWMRTH
jgi:hypothetical protein